MSPDYIIGVLAFVTIGGLIVIAVLHFGSHLRDPKNRASAKAAIIDDESSAHTAVRGGPAPDHLKG